MSEHCSCEHRIELLLDQLCSLAMYISELEIYLIYGFKLGRWVSQTLCYCPTQGIAEALCIQKKAVLQKCSLCVVWRASDYLLWESEHLFCVLHAWCVHVLSGVLWEGKVEKEAVYLQGGQYQLAIQLGKSGKVLTKPESKLGDGRMV